MKEFWKDCHQKCSQLKLKKKKKTLNFLFPGSFYFLKLYYSL